MICVTVGSSKFPFDRLLAAVDELTGRWEVFAQTGSSRLRLAGVECVDFMPFDELVARFRGADVVVTHAGVGSIMAALMHGSRPIVVPRRKAFGEAVDDHQVSFARRLGESGLVTVVEDPAELAQTIAALQPVDVRLNEDGQLARELRAYISAELALGPA